jgi:hypothetical protein
MQDDHPERSLRVMPPALAKKYRKLVAGCQCSPENLKTGLVQSAQDTADPYRAIGYYAEQRGICNATDPDLWEKVRGYFYAECGIPSREADQMTFQQWIDLLRPVVTADDSAGPGSVRVSPKMSPKDLSRKHNVSLKALRGRLDRWRYEHDSGYSEVANRKRNEPHFLYDESAVMPIIEAMKAKSTDAQQGTDGQRKKI